MTRRFVRPVITVILLLDLRRCVVKGFCFIFGMEIAVALCCQQIAEMETAFAGRMRLEHDEKVKVIKNLQQDNSSKLDGKTMAKSSKFIHFSFFVLDELLSLI